MREIVPKATALRSITLVNWGAWDGANTFEIDPGTSAEHPGLTILSGMTGSGKSTILDGYAHLMYGRRVRFNDAAGRQGEGRYEGRTVCSYMKGRLGDVEHQEGGVEHQFLRPNDRNPVWSAVSCSFEDMTTGSCVSAAVIDWLPVGCDRDSDVASLYVIRSAGDVDALYLQSRGLLGSRPDRRSIQSVWPDAVVEDRAGVFRATLAQRLGSTERAMGILRRIQSGVPFTSVDRLCKDLVVEPSKTYALAGEVVAEFDKANELRHTYELNQKRIDILGGVSERVADYDQRECEKKAIDDLTTRPDGSKRAPIDLWKAETAVDVYRSDLERLSTEIEAAAARAKERQGAADAAEARRREIQRSIDQSGGSRLSELEASIARLKADREARADQRSRLGQTIRDAKVDPSSQGSWDASMAKARAWASDATDREAALEAAHLDAMTAKREAEHALEEARTRLSEVESHRSGLPRAMQEARAKIAAATGIDPEKLPFLAEVVDVAEGREEWRCALDDAIGNISRILLVPKRYEGLFRRTVDPLAGSLGNRYSFEFVDTERGEWDPTPNEGCISSVAQVDPTSPFADYVAWRIAHNSPCDYRLVRSAGELSIPGRIAPSGQASTDGGGAVGHRGARPIIGYRSDLLIEDAREEVRNATAVLEDRKREVRRTREPLDEIRTRREAIGQLEKIAYRNIDVASCTREIDSYEAERAGLLADPTLGRLHSQLNEASEAATRLQGEAGAARAALSSLEHRAEAERKQRDRWEDEQGKCQAAGASLTDAQRRQLGKSWDDAVGTLGGEFLAGFSDDGLGTKPNLKRQFDRFDNDLRREADRIGLELETIKVGLLATFNSYRNDGEDADCPEANIKVRDKWVTRYNELVKKMLDLSRKDSALRDCGLVAAKLAQMNTRMREERTALEEDLKSINARMGEWAYGDFGGRLSLQAKERRTAKVRDFQAEVASLAGMATRIPESGDSYDMDELDADFEKLRAVCERLRGFTKHDPNCPPELVDPYASTEVEAHVSRPDREGTQVITSTVQMSGGERQETYAFLTAAAVMLALGDADAPRPSFMPYVMDEAFTVSDGDVTARALNVLRGMGFQVVFAAPEGKVPSYERELPLVLTVMNDRTTGISYQTEPWRPRREQ